MVVLRLGFVAPVGVVRVRRGARVRSQRGMVVRLPVMRGRRGRGMALLSVHSGGRLPPLLRGLARPLLLRCLPVERRRGLAPRPLPQPRGHVRRQGRRRLRFPRRGPPGGALRRDLAVDDRGELAPRRVVRRRDGCLLVVGVLHALRRSTARRGGGTLVLSPLVGVMVAHRLASVTQHQMCWSLTRRRVVGRYRAPSFIRGRGARAGRVLVLL